MHASSIPIDNEQLHTVMPSGGEQDLASIRRPGGIPANNLRNISCVFAVPIHDHDLHITRLWIAAGDGNRCSIRRDFWSGQYPNSICQLIYAAVAEIEAVDFIHI